MSASRSAYPVSGASMKPQRLLSRLFGRKPAVKPRLAKTEAEKAREFERTIQAGVAMNKFPPR